MNQLYKEVSSRLIESVKQYMDGTITLEDLKEADLHEKLVYEHQTWDSLEQSLRSNIFVRTKELYEEINKMDKNIREMDQRCKSALYDIDEDAVKAHAHLLGRNRMPPAGFYNTTWYLGPVPTLNMVDALKENIQKPVHRTEETDLYQSQDKYVDTLAGDTNGAINVDTQDYANFVPWRVDNDGDMDHIALSSTPSTIQQAEGRGSSESESATESVDDKVDSSNCDD